MTWVRPLLLAGACSGHSAAARAQWNLHECIIASPAAHHLRQGAKHTTHMHSGQAVHPEPSADHDGCPVSQPASCANMHILQRSVRHGGHCTCQASWSQIPAWGASRPQSLRTRLWRCGAALLWPLSHYSRPLQPPQDKMQVSYLCHHMVMSCLECCSGHSGISGG